ncbi:unnamed protein product [Boreogadus saida]
MGVDMQERTRLMKLNMNKYKHGAGSDSRLEQDYNKRSGRDPRGSDNLSAKSSDSDVSDVSGASRTSSVSRFSGTSYMSVQSERPQGNRKIRALQSSRSLSQEGEGEGEGEVGEQLGEVGENKEKKPGQEPGTGTETGTGVGAEKSGGGSKGEKPKNTAKGDRAKEKKEDLAENQEDFYQRSISETDLR